ncbi:MAG: DUF1570 domain-containing protein, partial [Planctomycetales bacterium]|nr:DUF1570 domain-containing protein [Planctomycetales bacterium]
HSRTAQQPVWLAEGLATMFEAPGVYRGDAHRQLSDRINRQRLDRLRKRTSGGNSRGTVERLVGSDELFRSDPDLAYAASWALSFYLAERMPRQYCDLLAKTAARPSLKTYSRAQRLADFKSTVGDNLPMLEVQMLRFIDELP